MNTLVSSPSQPQGIKAVIVVSLLITGAAGVYLGGPILGLLGVVLILGSVWLATQTVRSAELSAEIERVYRQTSRSFPVAEPVQQRVTVVGRHRVLNPELESVRG